MVSKINLIASRVTQYADTVQTKISGLVKGLEVKIQKVMQQHSTAL
jgi:hypothetical protein